MYPHVDDEDHERMYVVEDPCSLAPLVDDDVGAPHILEGVLGALEVVVELHVLVGDHELHSLEYDAYLVLEDLHALDGTNLHMVLKKVDATWGTRAWGSWLLDVESPCQHACGRIHSWHLHHSR